jgi:hypothetical protein
MRCPILLRQRCVCVSLHTMSGVLSFLMIVVLLSCCAFVSVPRYRCLVRSVLPSCVGIGIVSSRSGLLSCCVVSYPFAFDFVLQLWCLVSCRVSICLLFLFATSRSHVRAFSPVSFIAFSGCLVFDSFCVVMCICVGFCVVVCVCLDYAYVRRVIV